MIKKISLLIVSALLLFSCEPSGKSSEIEQKQVPGLAQYVDPMVGTQRMGHTFPGVAAPFGIVQHSPGTNEGPYPNGGKYNRETYCYCAGRQYNDNTIFGFNSMHFSGVGHSDLGDPGNATTGKLKLEPGNVDEYAPEARN